MPARGTKEVFLTVPEMVAIQVTMMMLEVACIPLPSTCAMTALYETDVAVGLVTVQVHVVPVPQGVPTTVLPFRRTMWKAEDPTSWFAVAVRVTFVPTGTAVALATDRVTVQATLGETVSLVGPTGSQGLPALVVGAQSAGSWVVVT
jgi:hypothetical protein